MEIVVAMPIYEDWDSAIALCRKIDSVFRESKDIRVSLLLVDDGSARSGTPTEFPWPLEVIQQISILVLRRNLGHQRAIAIALAYLRERWHGDAVVVMDADGEDRPEDIPALLAAMKGTDSPAAVFAERGRRLEGLTFRISYHVYRVLHQLVTGRDIRFGNFSVLPGSYLDSLVAFPELWNHYGATVIKSRLPYVRVRADRGLRISGHSHMNFVSLVIHGLSALFANQELVGTRLLLMNVSAALFWLLGIMVVVGVRFLTHLAIPGWATTAMGLLLVLLGQSATASLVLVFSIMMNRSHLGFLPIRDYSFFVLREASLYSQ